KKDFRTNVVGTGPFKFKSYRTDVSMEWVRNPDYYMPGKPYVDGVTYFIVPDRASGKAALKIGQADIAAPVYLNLTDQDELNKTSGTRAFRYLNQNYEFFSVNAQVAPFNNVNVRKALYMAVDRNVFNQLVLAGSGQPVGAIPPDLGGYTVDELSKFPGYRKDKAQDLDEAKKLLAQEGQSNLSFSIIYRPGPGYRDSALFVQDQLAKIGVKVELKTMDDATFLDAAFNRKFQGQVMRQVPFPKDPSVILGSYFSTGDPSENTTATSNPKLDQMINEQAALALDFAARSKKLKEIQDFLITNGYNNVLAWGSYQGALRTSVQGYQPLTSIYNNLQHDTLWIGK
ncbi:MAG: ABC transporter substrate-binding protein, partial [Chloroflexota bacterium]